jgi:hypothetical protein
MVFASGTLSVSPSPRKRITESGPLISNSARSSLRLLWTCMIGELGYLAATFAHLPGEAGPFKIAARS